MIEILLITAHPDDEIIWFGSTLYQLTKFKNININGNNLGFIMITENANDIKAAIDERKSFVISTRSPFGWDR